jgi:hypothetical protein
MPASDSCGRQTAKVWDGIAAGCRSYGWLGKHRLRFVRWGREFLLGTMDISADLALF